MVLIAVFYLSEIVIYLPNLFSLRDIIEIDRGCILYLLIALSSKCSLNARIKDYVQLILQLNISTLVNISRYIIT